MTGTVNQAHEEKETLVVDVMVPGHDERVTTSLFTRTRRTLIEREGGACFICGRDAKASGHPLEAHHHPVERSFANSVGTALGSWASALTEPVITWENPVPTYLAAPSGPCRCTTVVCAMPR